MSTYYYELSLVFFCMKSTFFPLALCRIYFKVHFIKIVACYSIWIYRRSLAFIGLVMIHLTALDAVYVYTYCWYSILTYSYGEKMSQSCWLLYMSLSIMGIETRWCTHVQQYIYVNSILDDICDSISHSDFNIIGILYS
jgi:hypothetical protein